MQMRITKFQQVMGMRDAQASQEASQGGVMEERILALEEAHRQAQSKVEVALETTQLLKNSDVSSQVWALRSEMNSQLADMQQMAISSASLQAAIKNTSEEFQVVKQSVEELLNTNSALAVSVSGLTSTVSGVKATLDDQVAVVDSLTTGLEAQVNQLSEMAVSVDLHKVALETNKQQVVEIKEMLVAEQMRRALALEEQLQSVKLTLDAQLSSSQDLHSNLKAQLEAVHSQIEIATGAHPSSDPEEVEPVIEEVLPVTEEEEESSSLGEEPEATEDQVKDTVEEEAVEPAAVEEEVIQEQEVEEVTEEPAEQLEEEVTEEPAEQLEIEESAKPEATEEIEEELIEEQQLTEEKTDLAETSEEEGVTEEIVEQDIEEEQLIEEEGDLAETPEEEVTEEKQAETVEEPVEKTSKRRSKRKHASSGQA